MYAYVFSTIQNTRELFFNWYLVYRINAIVTKEDVVNVVIGLNLTTTDEMAQFLTSFFSVYGCHIKESTLKNLNELRKETDSSHNQEEFALVLLWTCIIEASSRKLIDFK
tara:strand:- start:135 stop:464 length:330 start_codon:yes stop_codon:yes gene_type:complete